MSKVEDIQGAIQSLSQDEYARLRRWFAARDWAAWDGEIEKDSDSGALDFLVEEALDEKAKGDLKEI
jgi:hypothetical protein